MGGNFWTECAAGSACKRVQAGRSSRVKMAPNRELDGHYFHPECIPQGRSVVDADDPRVPGYGEPVKYTRRTWDKEEPSTSGSSRSGRESDRQPSDS